MLTLFSNFTSIPIHSCIAAYYLVWIEEKNLTKRYLSMRAYTKTVIMSSESVWPQSGQFVDNVSMMPLVYCEKRFVRRRLSPTYLYSCNRTVYLEESSICGVWLVVKIKHLLRTKKKITVWTAKESIRKQTVLGQRSYKHRIAKKTELITQRWK